ncbi:MAG: cytochrome d ubiquinol oxidase subunit II [Simkania negevensis]|nr:cytochrome d ubiquinol oxidase subunit II [Simkania negevensis]
MHYLFENVEILKHFWYIVIGLSVILYAILDGFDLGVGILHLFVKTDLERRIFLNAIGPLWDGNEVWIVIIFGALFAGFPDAYASICSSFYTLMMILIFGVIFRAVAIEFRSKISSETWRDIWDFFFSIASLIIAFSIGILLGNLIQGIPIDQNGDFIGTFYSFFTPYPLLVGITSVTLFAMHGAVYLIMKTERELQAKLRKWVYPAILLFIVSYMVTTLATLVHMPHMIVMMKQVPVIFLVPAAAAISIAMTIRSTRKKKEGVAFMYSSLSIALLFSLFGVGTYPNLVRSTLSPEAYSITLHNAGASHLNLKVVTIVALIGVPLVLAYGFWIYKIFHGKVKIDTSSY